MSTHAFLSPSFAHIGYNCAAAALRSFQVRQRMELLREIGPQFYGITDPDKIETFKLGFDENEAATDGTALHEVFEHCLLNQKSDLKYVTEQIRKTDGISKSTRNDKYIHGIMSMLLADKLDQLTHASDVWVEKKIKIKGLPDHGTADVVWTEERVLNVDDLKTGYGEVQSEKNDQLMTYAVGVLDDLGWDNFDHVVLSVLGVRWESNEWETTSDELKQYKLDVMLPAFLAAYDINPEATPGKWCRYCDGKIHCREWQEEFEGQMNRTFDDGLVKSLKTPELVDLYKLCKQAESLMKFQLAPELLHKFEGFDVPEGISRVTAKDSKWVGTETEVVKSLRKRVDNPKDIYNKTLITPKEALSITGNDPKVSKMIETVNRKPYLKV